MEDSSLITSNNQRNAVIHKLIRIIEANGDTLDVPFYIIQNEDGEFEFTISGSALTRFKKKVYAYLVNNELTEAQERTARTYMISNGTTYPMFGISGKYTVEETLKIMSVRYALFNNYPKYADYGGFNISEGTLGDQGEYGDLRELTSSRKPSICYDSMYFSHILGYKD